MEQLQSKKLKYTAFSVAIGLVLEGTIHWWRSHWGTDWVSLSFFCVAAAIVGILGIWD